MSELLANEIRQVLAKSQVDVHTKHAVMKEFTKEMAAVHRKAYQAEWKQMKLQNPIHREEVNTRKQEAYHKNLNQDALKDFCLSIIHP